MTITCIVTGKEFPITKSQLKTKIEQWGSEEKFRQSYICKEAVSLLKKGYSINKIRELLKSPDGLAEVDKSIIDHYITKKKDITPSNLAPFSQTPTSERIKKFIENILNDTQ